MAGKKFEFEAIFLCLFLLLYIPILCNSLPLSTSSRWIVDRATGKRVKLACVNWVSHLQPMIAEGLEKKPLKYIAGKVSSMGFNCVRFTWATFMFTRANYSNITVSQSLDNFGLKDAKAGIARNNPRVLSLSVVDLHKAVVNELGKHNIMVVLDNHVSRPMWCCSDNDGNGFFGDVNFDPKEWVQGLSIVARTYKDNPTVAAISMRNELRGANQSKDDWRRYMEEGATTIHRENPNVLIIVSGLNYDTQLGFLKTEPFQVNFNDKLVFEAHWYTFGISKEKWIAQSNNICANIIQTAKNNYLFLISGNKPFPLFLSEFGIDQRGVNEADNRYISCLLATVAEYDIDWALWALQGSYILREGIANHDEAYGVLDINWDKAKNQSFLEMLQPIKRINQDVKPNHPIYYLLYHPLSGKCVKLSKTVFLTNCKTASRFDQHQDDGPIKLAGGSKCLGVVGEGDGDGVRASNDCSSKWRSVSSSRLHLAAPSGPGKFLCLEKNAADSRIVTKKCLCMGDNLQDAPSCPQNPEIQWFKLVPVLTERMNRPKVTEPTSKVTNRLPFNPRH